MLFPQRFRPGLRDGSVTLAFRRWDRPRVRAGTRLRTPIGVLAVDGVDAVEPNAIDEADARRAGYADRAELMRFLAGRRGRHVYRIELHHAGEDPRIELRSRDRLDEGELAALRGALERLDRSTRRGPWTAAYLQLIEAHPGVRAADLAPLVGRERLPFKADVRRLKELGLTESLEVGYRLSPRGRALLTAVHPPTRERGAVRSRA